MQVKKICCIQGGACRTTFVQLVSIGYKRFCTKLEIFSHDENNSFVYCQQLCPKASLLNTANAGATAGQNDTRRYGRVRDKPVPRETTARITETSCMLSQVQFEIAHNAIHAWIGGSGTYGMGHLHYASYDPVFVLHHSNTDRIFALWQKLQKYR